MGLSQSLTGYKWNLRKIYNFAWALLKLVLFLNKDSIIRKEETAALRDTHAVPPLSFSKITMLKHHMVYRL